MFKKLIVTVLFFTAIGNKSFANDTKPLTDSTITIKVKGVTCSGDKIVYEMDRKKMKSLM